MKISKLNKIILVSITFLIFITFMGQVYANEISINAPSYIIKEKDNARLKESIKRSEYNELMAGTEELEPVYNLKNNISNINVKDQKTSGSCWAFAFSNALETSIAKQYNKISKTFSPMHIEYRTSQMFNRNIGVGAISRLALAYCTSGNGPVEESQMPFDSVYNNETKAYKPLSEVGDITNKPILAGIKSAKEFPYIYKKLNNGIVEAYQDEGFTRKYTDEELKATRDLIKKHIKTYGGITAQMYMFTTTEESNRYYNISNAAYNYNNYSNDADKINHEVTIVGWDDNYSVDNFSGTKPTKPGAYIVLNSYGTSWGKDGYMYVSYEDALIEKDLTGLENVKEYENGNKDYDKLYQYDELGMNLGVPLSVPGEQNTAGHIYAASKYKRQSQDANKAEYLNEVGLYISSTSGIEVYANGESSNVEGAKLVAKQAEPLESGYHTIKLATPIKLTGNDFVIIVKYTNQEGAYLPLEANYKEMGLGDKNSSYNNATANEGECFISFNGQEWHDIVKVTANVFDGTTLNFKNASTCIKAFTTLQEEVATNPVASVKLNKEQTTLEVEQTETLVATITPENATNKNVKWASSNEKIATVTEAGIVKAISVGTATITATTEDGNKTATCVVQVKEKTNSGNEIYEEPTKPGQTGGEVGGTLGENKTNQSTNIYGSSPSKDLTIANKILPFAGNYIILVIAIAVMIVITIVILIKYRKLKDVK